MSDEAPDKMRLNRWFTEQGICSRREADRWIADGRVTVNGQPAAVGMQIGEGDSVAVDGRVVRKQNRPAVVIAFNKPVGVECTSDASNPDNIIAAVGYPERLVHIGRLDQMSEGLILLTNRGDIVNLILRSEFAHEKEYQVDFAEPVTDEQIQQWARGLDIGDGRGRTKPCQVERLGARRVKMILTEGRNRQIRRMAEAVGHHVKRLERLRIMHIRLAGLARGKWRHLSQSELKELWNRLELRGSERPRTEKPTITPRTITPRAAAPKAIAPKPASARLSPTNGVRRSGR